MEFFGIDWTAKHILKTNTKLVSTSINEELSSDDLKREVEPWFSAIFQSEHLSVLIGSGLTSSVSFLAGIKPQEMWRLDLKSELAEKVKEKADNTAIEMKRGEANIEDDIRITLELINGLNIIKDPRAKTLATELNEKLKLFIGSILSTE
jgi:hypothetical protein